MNNDLLRHTLATIAYRFRKTIDGADEAFFKLESPNGIRTPLEIIHHMAEVMTFSIAITKDAPREKIECLTINPEIDRFFELLKATDALFEQREIPIDTAYKLIQGPLSDVLTHIGQLAMLRRKHRMPITKESFVDADIRIGNIN